MIRVLCALKGVGPRRVLRQSKVVDAENGLEHAQHYQGVAFCLSVLPGNVLLDVDQDGMLAGYLTMY